jgi:hypothetical protein
MRPLYSGGRDGGRRYNQGDMPAPDEYPDLIVRLFREWESWPGPQAHFEVEVVADRENDHYLLLTVGWDGYKRIYGTLIHIDIIDGKLWIQRDNTEDGIATHLVAAGVPKDRIVLAFYPETVREYGEFAIK